jgi:hypothetical protein
MNYKVSRRRFGQLAVGGTILSGFSYLTNKALAQTPSFKIIGIGSGLIISANQTVIPEVNTTELDNIISKNILRDIEPIGLGLVLQSFDLQSLSGGKNQLVTSLTSQILAERDRLLVQSNEGLSAFSSLKDGIRGLIENETLNSLSSLGDRIRALIGSNETLNSLNSLKNGIVADRVQALVESNETLSGLTSLSDGTLVLVANPVISDGKQTTPTRIILLSTPVKTLIVSGLEENQQLGSLLGTNDGRLLGLVGKKNGTPPIRLVDINLQTGQISFNTKIKFPSDERVSNLAQCPDGKLYTSLVGFDGDTTLVQLDSNQKKPIRLAQLKVNGQLWNNGLQSLVCSPTGQLIAFGAMRYETPNAVYSVDKTNGNMIRLQDFDAAQITLARG